MTTVVRGKVPADEFALSETLTALQDVEIETGRIVKSGENAVMPLLWVRNVDSEAFEAAAGDDQSVDELTLLCDLGDELLYQMNWVHKIKLVLQMLTNSQATILDAYGQSDYWHIRILYPSREKFDETQSFCETHNLSFDIEAIREMDGEPAGRYGLTDGQYDALVAAADAGYFEIPRETSLEDLADDFDVSHQALSERIRRGTEALVEDALMIGVPDKETRL